MSCFTSRRLSGALVLALLSAPALAQSPSSYDDRWYLTFGAGANHQDNARDTENAAFGTVGVGKFINPRWSLDATLDYQKPKANANEDLNYSQYGISLDARRHFRKDGRRANPYIVGGVGYQRAHEEFDAFPDPNSPQVDKRGYATAKLGVGAQADFKRVSLRGEIAARHGFDSDSRASPTSNGFTDTLASLTILVPLGGNLEQHEPTPAPMPVVAPLPPSCEVYDADGDGIDDCVDACPTGGYGAMDNTGCPHPVSIDLRKVHFDFNSARLGPMAQALLDDAVSLLRQNPGLTVDISGHTDSIGSMAYNQGLSELRAQAVYDYLVANGVESHRVTGIFGYGETRPVAPNTHDDGSDNPEGRSYNRRVELELDGRE